LISWLRRWRLKRRLGSLLPPGERLMVIERLPLGGWWVIGTGALYIAEWNGTARRVPLGDIALVQTHRGQRSTQITVVQRNGAHEIGDLRLQSSFADKLRGVLPAHE